MPKTKTSYKPGVSGNPNGRPKDPYIKAFEDAIKKDSKENKESLMEFYIKEARKDNKVLISVMKKNLPDRQHIEADVTGNMTIQVINSYKKEGGGK